MTYVLHDFCPKIRQVLNWLCTSNNYTSHQCLKRYLLDTLLGNCDIRNFTFRHCLRPKWPKLMKYKIDWNHTKIMLSLRKGKHNKIQWNWTKSKYYSMLYCKFLLYFMKFHLILLNSIKFCIFLLNSVKVQKIYAKYC